MQCLTFMADVCVREKGVGEGEREGVRDCEINGQDRSEGKVDMADDYGDIILNHMQFT